MFASLVSKGPRLISLGLAIAVLLCWHPGKGARAAPQGASVSASARTVATAQLNDLMPPTQNERIYSTVAFFSENTLALVLCRNYLDSDCLLVVLDLTGGNIRVLARTENVYSGTTLFRSGKDFILEPHLYGHPARLYSRDLSTEEQIPTPRYVSPTGSTIAVLTKGSALRDKNEWALYNVQLSPLPSVEKLRNIIGDLQAVSDDKLVIRVNDTMQTETMDGRVLGAFAVKPKHKAQTDVQFAGKDRLYVSTWHHDRIVDINGKDLVKLRAPAGWEYRRGWSTDGKRLLYDHYTRKIPFLRSAGEAILALGTLGLGAVDEGPNGEAIRVIDTTTGNICFDWNDPKRLIDTHNHADISPDGKLVAAVMRGALTIYRLPDSCGQN